VWLCLVVIGFFPLYTARSEGFSGWKREGGWIRSKELNEVFEEWDLACYAVLGVSRALHEYVWFLGPSHHIGRRWVLLGRISLCTLLWERALRYLAHRVTISASSSHGGQIAVNQSEFMSSD